MKQKIFFHYYLTIAIAIAIAIYLAIALKSHFHSTAGMLCSDMLHAEPMYDIYGSDTVKVINLNLQTTAVLVCVLQICL